MPNLLLEIAKCSDIAAAMSDENHPCHRIVSLQKGKPFQIPEPWNGNLQEAQILFISSNPSISSLEKEEYPVETWTENKIQEFFLNRFSTPYDKNNVRFWTYIKKYAGWTLDMDASDEELPKKICITEVVHCKSVNEKGVTECCDHCADKWLGKVLAEFQGQYIILLGSRAKRFEAQVRAAGKPVLWMPHPVSGRWTDTERKDSITEKKKEINGSNY